MQIVLVAFEGKDTFSEKLVEKEVAYMSDTIAASVEESGGNANARVLLPGMTGPTLDKFIAYCEYHCKSTTEVNAVREEVSRAKKNLDHKAEAAASAGIQKIKERDKTWDTQYLQVPKTTLFDIVEAANYLYVKPLLELSCLAVANMMQGATHEEIMAIFDFTGSDFSAEIVEEEKQEKIWEWTLAPLNGKGRAVKRMRTK